MAPSSPDRAPRNSGAAQRDQNDLVLSYLSLRRAIGMLGYFLPAALIAWSLGFGSGILDSISDYYYSPMREVFTGTLAALAVFLWSYKGYAPESGELITDRRTARIASLGALGTALLPAPPDPEAVTQSCTLAQCILGETLSGRLHFAAATLFFAALAIFCLVLFTRGGDHRANRIYRICGGLIIGAMVSIALVTFTPLKAALDAYQPVFWLEVIATVAFATSWAVKGDSISALQRDGG